MRAEDLKLEEIIDISEGKLDFHGRKVVAHSLNAMSQLRKDLTEKLGKEEARYILTRFGFFGGQADAAAMLRLFKWPNKEELLRCGPKLHSIMGIVQPKIEKLELDVETKKLRMDVTWYNSAEAEGYLHDIGISEEPVCWIMTGYADGYASFSLGFDVYFMETECAAAGSNVCRVTGKDAGSWSEDVIKYKSYYNLHSVHEKVEKLTVQLKQTTRELKKRSNAARREDAGDKNVFIEIRSKSYLDALDKASRVAKFDSSVLITGETGAGKEVLAKYIHRNSSRAKNRFVAVNCAALPDTLLESELFGHKAGSFTGAIRDRVGLFEEANGGTLFLDEIGDITPGMQTRLLRVLQEKEMFRVGESIPRRTDVRVIAATNRDLMQEVQNGKFREDLYYRIRVVEIAVPPLRDRAEDILPMARFFIQKLAKKLGLPRLRLDSTCLDHLLSYSWPGNVRELENVLENASIMAEGGTILPENLPFGIQSSYFARSRQTSSGDTLEGVEKEHIRSVLLRCNGNKAQASRILGISTTTLWRKMKEMNIE